MKQEELIKLRDSMSLKEKVDQMLQLSETFYMNDPESVLTGPARDLGLTEEDLSLCGSILGGKGAEFVKKHQDDYMQKHPHHIPMLLMMDVIHGFKTIFPAPIGQGATFEPELSEKCAAVAAKEAAVSGLHVTFSPMVDLVRDARWGRVVESNGEDPYLNSLFAAAQVRGFQGENMADPYKLCACVKHFAGYGGAAGGRDYNTVELSEHTFREYYLKSYKAAIDAGAGMVMTSFNTINGIPASTNKWLMREILRDEMGFDGVLISDFAAIYETIAHGHSADGADAAKKAIEAGVDIDMMSNVYSGNLCRLAEEGIVPESLIDECVLRILELKNKLGLFENPYKDADAEKEKELILCQDHRALAREAAAKSFVLLKNDGILPLDRKKKTAFIGPYTYCRQIMSSWAIIGEEKDCIHIEEAAREVMDPEKTVYAMGSPILENTTTVVAFGDKKPDVLTDEEQDRLLAEAIEIAREAEVIVMPLGESFMQSGEASSRAMIEIPEIQMRLFREISRVNSNIIVVLFNGRPLDLREISKSARAILDVWFPGTEGGHAILDVLTGKVNPSGKLPMSFPYCVGQVPVHYNAYATGRPEPEGRIEKFRSRYLDIPNAPLYPFGYGLSYTTFTLSPVTLSRQEMTAQDHIIASVTVKNTGDIAGTEVVQLYIRDMTGSVVRPVKELKGFEKVTLEAGEARKVSFRIEEEMLRFLRADGSIGSEPGQFMVWIGTDSSTKNEAEFELK